MDHYHWHIEFMPRLTKISGIRVGKRFLSEPDSAGRSGEVFARGEGEDGAAGAVG